MKINIFGRDFMILAEDRQWNKLKDFIIQYFVENPAVQIAVILMLFVLAISIFAFFSEGRKKDILKRTALVMYVLILIILFILCRERKEQKIRFFGVKWYLTEKGFHEGNVLISMINFIIFIPYGMLLKWQVRRSHWIQMFEIVISTSVLIEIIQFVSGRGNMAIQDIISYSLAGLLGVMVCNKMQKRN